MPRVTISLPNDIHSKLVDYAKRNDDSLSSTIAKMADIGIMVTENQKNKKKGKEHSEIEEHCYKLAIQMNIILKNLASKNLGFGSEELDKIRDSAINKYNTIMGIKPEEL